MTETVITVVDSAVVLTNTSAVTIEVGTPAVILTGVMGPPGPPGLQGPAGPVGSAEGAFLVTNRFNEIAADEIAKEAARQNLGLAIIDGGTFF